MVRVSTAIFVFFSLKLEKRNVNINFFRLIDINLLHLQIYIRMDLNLVPVPSQDTVGGLRQEGHAV